MGCVWACEEGVLKVAVLKEGMEVGCALISAY